MKPLVSIVIPCYNAECWVGETIQSCLQQTYRPLEIIVVDDGSTDRSKMAIREASRADEVPLILIEAEHKGGSAARNRGLASASGDYLQFLDADDTMSPVKIERQVALVSNFPEDLACGPWMTLRRSPEGWIPEMTTEQMDAAGDLVSQWIEGAFFAVHAVLWPRKRMTDLGGWDESLTAWQDSDLFIRAALRGFQFRFVPDSVVYYRRGHNPDSVSMQWNPDSIMSRLRVLDMVRDELERRGQMEDYRAMMAPKYYSFARNVAFANPAVARECFSKFLQDSPDGRVPGTLANHIGTRLLGVVNKERLARALHLMSGFLAPSKHNGADRGESPEPVNHS